MWTIMGLDSLKMFDHFHLLYAIKWCSGLSTGLVDISGLGPNTCSDVRKGIDLDITVFVPHHKIFSLLSKSLSITGSYRQIDYKPT